MRQGFEHIEKAQVACVHEGFPLTESVEGVVGAYTTRKVLVQIGRVGQDLSALGFLSATSVLKWFSISKYPVHSSSTDVESRDPLTLCSKIEWFLCEVQHK